MMQVDPAPGLRHRVADRLEVPARRSWTLPAFATAAALFVLVAALALLRIPWMEPAMEPRVATAPAATPGRPAPSPQIQAEPAEPSTRSAAASLTARSRPRPSASIFGKPTGRVSAASLGTDAPGEEREPPVVPPLPGTLAPLAPITIAPITVTPIRIQPMTLRPIRDQK